MVHDVCEGYSLMALFLVTPRFLGLKKQNPDMIVSSSRDKSIIVWKLQRGEDQYGYPHRSLTGHSHFVSEVVISSDGQFAL